MSATAGLFDHVLRLSDDIGIFEHAEGSVPRRHLGYCVDDVARALLVAARQPEPSGPVRAVTAHYLDFVASAQAPDGRCRNRFGIDRLWHDEPSVEDCWGRALWGLGTAAARASDEEVRVRARHRFARSAGQRSPFRRSMAFAALGAAEILTAHPHDALATALLADVVAMVGRPGTDKGWPWPEARLGYANAALPEALIAAGEHLGDQRSLDDGLQLLAWLIDIETAGDHLSVTPVGGWAPGQARPGFDQQPIEVAALADACVRAQRVTGDDIWAQVVEFAIGWFLGNNDAACSLYDPGTGGGCDGLQPSGRNENQGAESTLALIATLQHRRVLVGP